MNKVLFFLSFILPLIFTRSIPFQVSDSSDEVLSLPGYNGPLKSRVFSGYLTVGGSKHMHYLFVQSESNPSFDPVIVWLNGGPGCSSLGGLFQENGPWSVDQSDYSKLVDRPYRWSRMANVLYIEAPVGVGFSYSTNPSVDYNCNDDQTAQDNMQVLNLFFQKYPEYLSHSLFIAGESYAGIYVPTLAEAIAKAGSSYTGAPLKGIAVGNGCTGYEIGMCSQTTQSYYYLWQFLLGTAFVSNDVKAELNSQCSWADAQKGLPLSDACYQAMNDGSTQIGHINVYDIYGDCVNSIPSTSLTGKRHGRIPNQLNIHKLSGPDACIDSRDATGYLNQPAVMSALHVVPPPFTWEVCATPNNWNYTSTRPNLPRDTYPLLVKNYRVLIYNGDFDSCVPHTDNEAWTENMGFQVLEPWHAWNYTTEGGATNQVGGYAVRYSVPGAVSGSSFRFITVRGAGHLVPGTAPDKGFTMLSKFINGEPF